MHLYCRYFITVAKTCSGSTLWCTVGTTSSGTADTFAFVTGFITSLPYYNGASTTQTLTLQTKGEFNVKRNCSWCKFDSPASFTSTALKYSGTYHLMLLQLTFPDIVVLLMLMQVYLL